MTKTEILRRMLDERGVEWTKPKSATEFIQTTFLRNGWGIEVLERNIGLCVTASNIFDTPEQAIAATMGSGECEAIYDKSYHKGIHGYCEGLKCSNCENPLFSAFYYCPWCGARIRKMVKQ